MFAIKLCCRPALRKRSPGHYTLTADADRSNRTKGHFYKNILLHCCCEVGVV